MIIGIGLHPYTLVEVDKMHKVDRHTIRAGWYMCSEKVILFWINL